MDAVPAVALAVSGVWLAVGLGLSVRSRVQRAGRDGAGGPLAVAAGAVLAVGAEWALLGLAVLAVLVWRVV